MKVIISKSYNKHFSKALETLGNDWFGFVVFGAKISYEKRPRNLLMKLTRAIEQAKQL